jgi:hypothetical protein
MQFPRKIGVSLSEDTYSVDSLETGVVATAIGSSVEDPKSTTMARFIYN